MSMTNEELNRVNSILLSENTELKEKLKEVSSAYDTVKADAIRHHDLLITLLERFDQHADGTVDATALEHFCNEMIGLYNGIVSLGDARTLKAELSQLKQSHEAMVEDARVIVNGLKAVEALIEESRGVFGLHLNGEPAQWNDLRSGGCYENWLVDFDVALSTPLATRILNEQKKGVI